MTLLFVTVYNVLTGKKQKHYPSNAEYDQIVKSAIHCFPNLKMTYSKDLPPWVSFVP
jgi:hypothetical protein